MVKATTLVRNLQHIQAITNSYRIPHLVFARFLNIFSFFSYRNHEVKIYFLCAEWYQHLNKPVWTPPVKLRFSSILVKKTVTFAYECDAFFAGMGVSDHVVGALHFDGSRSVPSMERRRLVNSPPSGFRFVCLHY